MESRTLGIQGLEVGAIGLGCMGLTNYGGADPKEGPATLRKAVESGVTLFDTADAYGPHVNEEIVGQALRSVRDRVVIATKFGNLRRADGSQYVDGSPEHVNRACEGSLRRLGIETIDLYYQHRVDPSVPIEDTVGAMSQLVDAGKVRYLGLSEAGADTIRRAHRVHPISAVQSEYSLWTRGVESEVLPTLRELGIGMVAYSPVGRGFLTGTVRDRTNFSEKDSRLRHPRFAPGNLDHNLALLAAVEAIAARIDALPSQVALAWLLAQGQDVVPIPGTTKRVHLEQNLAAADLALSEGDLADLDGLLIDFTVAGERYPMQSMAYLET